MLTKVICIQINSFFLSTLQFINEHIGKES